MPRAKQRRWWLERCKSRRWGVSGAYEVHTNDLASHVKRNASTPDAHMLLALWRLVQWKQMRIERWYARWVEAVGNAALAYANLADADAAVLDARVREEELRVRLEQATRRADDAERAVMDLERKEG